MYKRILVPLDHSEVDEVILRHVSELAKCCGSTIVLYRVAHYHTRDSRAHEIEEAEEYLSELRTRLEADGLNVATAIGQGEPVHAISEDAEKLECDLIAMPIHGHTGITRFVMGSVAEGVKRETRLPLLMVKPQSAKE